LRRWGETLHALAVSLSQPTTNTVLDITVNAPHAERIFWVARLCVYLVYLLREKAKRPLCNCVLGPVQFEPLLMLHADVVAVPRPWREDGNASSSSGNSSKPGSASAELAANK
jgi:hypothetical protein